MSLNMNRRRFLRNGLGAGLALPAAGLVVPATGCATEPSEPAPGALFHLGVASGLHSADAAVLWTRVDPRVATPSSVTWEVSSTADFTSLIDGGTVAVDGANDYCVKVLATGLPSDANLWYRFRSGAETSTVGRARTLPPPGAEASRLNLAFASCQMFGTGFYGAWKEVATWDVDAVLFLGDYIYETGLGPIAIRPDHVGEVTSLADYRSQYRRARSDRWLQAAHAAHPFITIWDDHEIVNDHDRQYIADNPERASAAYTAWFEYQPVWPIDGTRIFRDLRWGDLAHLTLLDSRQYRDSNDGAFDTILGATLTPKLAAADRTMLGAAQRQFLLDSVDSAHADAVTWKVLGNPVMMAPFRMVDLDTPQTRAIDPNLIDHQGLYRQFDGWDGFSAERDNLLAHFHASAVDNLTILTGDYHAFFKSALTVDYDEPGSPVIAHEWVTSSISSLPLNLLEHLVSTSGHAATTPVIEYADTQNNGVGLIEMTPESQTVTFYRHQAVRGSAANPAVPRPAARWVRAAGSTDTVRTPIN